MRLDDIDKRILRVLQRDGRIANNDLSREVGLSASPCLRRVKLLEDAGIIDRYVALLNPAKVGKGMTFFVRIKLDQQDEETLQNFAQEIKKLPQVVECYFIFGEYDAMLRVLASDIDEYRTFQTINLSKIKGVQTLKTEIPSQIIKQTSEIPL